MKMKEEVGLEIENLEFLSLEVGEIFIGYLYKGKAKEK